jgi:ferrochelatase
LGGLGLLALDLDGGDAQGQPDATMRAVTEALARRGLAARPCAAVAAARADGVDHLVGISLHPQYARATVGAARRDLEASAAAAGLLVACVERYPDAAGFVEALADRIAEAAGTLPAQLRDEAPVLFAARALPERDVRRGDPYLDDVRITAAAVARRLGLGPRAELAFHGGAGRRWLGPPISEAVDRLAAAGHAAVVVCPVSLVHEHGQALRELDAVCRDRARVRGLRHLVRASTVGAHPAFIEALAALALTAARTRGWA